jgi:light-harvesting complex I chlorophyll a/b binding protein 1
MLSVVSAAAAFSGPALAPRMAPAPVSMRAEGEIGVTPPLGVFDPLGCLAEPVEYPRRDYRRYVELEIKHGRISMLAVTGILVTEAGIRWPGYLSKSLDLKFSDVPGGPFDSYAAVPALGWLQIVGFVIFLELAYGAVDPSKEPGDVGGVSWIRYDDPEVKKFKLNVRAAAAAAALRLPTLSCTPLLLVLAPPPAAAAAAVASSMPSV